MLNKRLQLCGIGFVKAGSRYRHLVQPVKQDDTIANGKNSGKVKERLNGREKHSCIEQVWRRVGLLDHKGCVAVRLPE